MAFGATRISAFDAYLRDNSVPIQGISASGDAPDGISIQYEASATQQQIDWSENAKQSFDWRKRRALGRNTIVTALANLTTTQQNAILRHVCAFIAKQNPAEVISLTAVIGVSLPVDEVDPTEVVP